jgi:hypothetical protein
MCVSVLILNLKNPAFKKSEIEHPKYEILYAITS